MLLAQLSAGADDTPRADREHDRQRDEFDVVHCTAASFDLTALIRQGGHCSSQSCVHGCFEIKLVNPILVLLILQVSQDAAESNRAVVIQPFPS